jgi:hypothetical protein
VVVLTGVGSDVAEDGELVDVGVVFWIESFQLWVGGGVAGAGQAGITLVNLDVGSPLLPLLRSLDISQIGKVKLKVPYEARRHIYAGLDGRSAPRNPAP